MNDNSTEEIKIFSKIKIDDIVYESKFEQDGLKIPMVSTHIYQCGPIPKISNKPYYLKIPKDVILDMLKEYLPELKEEIKAIIFSNFQTKEEMSPTDPRRVEIVPL